MPARAGKKNRKWGRRKNKPCQQRYTKQCRWILNKAKRIVRHLRKHPNFWTYSKLPSAAVLEKVSELRKNR